VASHVWATWHHLIHQVHWRVSTADSPMCMPCHSSTVPFTGPMTTMRRTDMPCVTVHMGHMSSYGHAMCYPCSGDTCHLLVGPPVLSMPSSIRLVSLPTIPAMSFVQTYDLYSQLPRGTIWTVQLAFFFLFGKMNKSP
jgi:hypothetical protein